MVGLDQQACCWQSNATQPPATHYADDIFKAMKTNHSWALLECQ